MSNPILESLRQAMSEYDESTVRSLAISSISEGIDPLKTMSVLTEAINDIGDRFGSGELWLPDLLRGANAMSGAMPILQAEIKSRGGESQSRGKIVIGTVFGDVHSIGVDMVATLLTAGGFEVNSLGVNVSAEVFIDAVRTDQPDILAMSALLTTTAPEQKRVIKYLAENDVRDRVKVMVGGGAITETFANEIGADGYAPDAISAVNLAARLVSN